MLSKALRFMQECGFDGERTLWSQGMRIKPRSLPDNVPFEIQGIDWKITYAPKKHNFAAKSIGPFTGSMAWDTFHTRNMTTDEPALMYRTLLGSCKHMLPWFRTRAAQLDGKFEAHDGNLVCKCSVNGTAVYAFTVERGTLTSDEWHDVVVYLTGDDA